MNPRAEPFRAEASGIADSLLDAERIAQPEALASDVREGLYIGDVLAEAAQFVREVEVLRDMGLLFQPFGWVTGMCQSRWSITIYTQAQVPRRKGQVFGGPLSTTTLFMRSYGTGSGRLPMGRSWSKSIRQWKASRSASSSFSQRASPRWRSFLAGPTCRGYR